MLQCCLRAFPANTVYIILIIPHILCSTWEIQRGYQSWICFAIINVMCLPVKLQVPLYGLEFWWNYVFCLTFFGFTFNCFFLPQTVQCLLDSGADINRPNVSGATPLYFACRYDILYLQMYTLKIVTYVLYFQTNICMYFL